MSRNGSPVEELLQQGQSLWLDNIRRQLITSGELARLRDEGLRGVTSNPTIFEKAVSGSTDYDESLVKLVGEGRKPDDILWDLMVEDIRGAADVFRPVYDQTKGADGFVSIEVSPDVARDTRKTVAMARDLWKRCDRPNVMVKIPATKQGLPAIRQMLGEGVNINVTLTFSVDRYVEVVDAFMAGLEDLRDRKGDVGKVHSVASFFVSRVDTKVDKLLDAKIAEARDPKERRRLERLLGKAGIANSKMAYERFKELHSGPRWESLNKAGAAVQRCLWASTSVKDPRYPDTMYVEELIGPDTVDTVPPATLAAFREHGEVRRSLDEHLDVARRQLRALAEIGIDLDDVTRELEVEGVELFAKSYESLGKTLREAAREIKRGKGPRQWHNLGPLQPVVDRTAAQLQKEDATKRLWSRDGRLWKGDAGQWLGWVNVAEKMESREHELRDLARAGRTYSDVVLLGMGGSSLGPDVLRNTFGEIRGHPRLHVLDTTDPAAIEKTTKAIDLPETLFIVASKSGTTTETLSHHAHFWALVEKRAKGKAGRQFAAITDPGTPLEKTARDEGFRWVFLNPPDIGGRYSVLSYFGLVPAALAGIDYAELLDRALEMGHACDPSLPVAKNSGVWLGAVMGGLATSEGRDKLTLLLSPKVATFGYWVEQLIAESTGKDGMGIVPVEGEPIGKPAAYGDDRLFVHVRMDGEPDDAKVDAIEKAGHPVVTLTMRDKLDLGGEFFRWEVATAIAGHILGINAFDQPNVQESKDNTKKVLTEFKNKGRLPSAPTVLAAEAQPELEKLLGRLKPKTYLAMMAYTARDRASERAIAAIRASVRDARRVATTAGYGPRFLHSTGQLHKGGPPEGVFLQVVQDDRVDVPIPGQPYSFGTLKQAQALGDYRSLDGRGLPVLRVTLGRDHAKGWAALAGAVERVAG
jgi:transaldolase/glucose-6-phosphate isomerase